MTMIADNPSDTEKIKICKNVKKNNVTEQNRDPESKLGLPVPRYPQLQKKYVTEYSYPKK